MKQLIMAAAGVALIASVGSASAQTTYRNGVYNPQGHFSQRNVRLRSEPVLPNANYKYGPYPEYPQSPPGGGW